MNDDCPAGSAGPISQDDDDIGEITDNYITCPLLQLKYSRRRKPIGRRLGQKGHKAISLKHDDDNRPLFENKTAEADLRGSFYLCSPKKLVNDLGKLNLNDPPFFHSGLEAQNVCNLETPSDTYVNLNINTVRRFKPKLPLSTKRSLYSNKENLPIQSKEELKISESKQLAQRNISTSSNSLTLKENLDIVNKSAVKIKNDSYNISFETSKNIYDTSLYYTVHETTTIPDPSGSSFSIKNSESLNESSLSMKELECQPVDYQSEDTALCALDLCSTPKQKSIYPRSPNHSSPVEFAQGEDKILYTPSSVCVKCAHENFIVVKGINYSILNTLGHGGSSIVFEVLHPNTNRVVAIKKVDLSEVEDIIAKGYLNEVNLLQNLQDCENVIRLFDSEYTTEEKILYMVMEKGDTDLSKLIRSTKNMSVHMIMYYWSEMLTTVNEVHMKGIIHSDLKPANFLLVSGRLKLIDFGIASKIQGDMTSVLKDATTGTWNYMSPECIRSGGSSFQGHKINQKSDVWSLGCILYSLIYGKTPYSHLTNTWQKLKAIADPNENIDYPSCSEIFNQSIPPVLMQTMKLCLIKDVKARPYVVDLLRLIGNVYATYDSTT